MSGLFAAGHDRGFLEAVATAWLDACGNDPVRAGDGLILLPTRRGVRALTDAFLRVSNRPALLLPRIGAIGAVDEAPLAIAGGLDLPPAIGRLQRLASLARLVLAREAAPTPAAAFELAASLADLIDEAARWKIDLAAALPSLAPGELALHWHLTLDFLSIVTSQWPRALQELGLLDPAARQAALLDAQAALWRGSPPDTPVWLAGIIAATPSEIGLAQTVAGLPTGRVILPGLDLALAPRCWDAIGDTHPQAGLRRLLAGMHAARDDVTCLGPQGAGTRTDLLRRAMLPEAEIAATWRKAATLDVTGFSVIAAPDERTEACAIALALRHAIETGGRTAALVTPDRRLAQRVATELGRFGVLADDSAGEPLADTPQAVFLRLVATTLAEGLPPATLLAMLKHPLAQLGGAAACRREARRLERACLRGPRPQPGLAGLRRALAGARVSEPDRESVSRFLDRLDEAVMPLASFFERERVWPAPFAGALIETAERLADPDRLWSGEEGEALAAYMTELSEALALLGPIPPGSLPGLLDATLAGVNVHGRRGLRGRDAAEIHPRVSIWGLLEARGQRADLLVLGGLTEGTWPAATDPGPWMGRPMRAAIGLPSPEIAIGTAAHDFATLATAAPDIILSYAKRRDHAPAVPSRWIARLESCLAGVGQVLPAHPALQWEAALDQPDGVPRPARPPAPRPPVANRPRRLSVTEIETWLRDPYAIYAAHILRLRPLAPIEEEAERALFGNLVHHALADAYRRGPIDATSLQARFDDALEHFAVRPGIAAWWRPRLRRIAEWVAASEAARRAEALPDHVETEIGGRHVLQAAAGPFALTGRADRIERRAGGLAILDYKTGTVPTRTAIRHGWSPQLALEATMASLGGFGDAFRDQPVRELAHWKLSGGPEPGQIQAMVAGEALDLMLADTWYGLEQRIEAFDDPATAYLAQPYPSQAPAYDNYAVLARIAEWRVTEDDR